MTTQVALVTYAWKVRKVSAISDGHIAATDTHGCGKYGLEIWGGSSGFKGGRTGRLVTPPVLASLSFQPIFTLLDFGFSSYFFTLKILVPEDDAGDVELDDVDDEDEDDSEDEGEVGTDFWRPEISCHHSEWSWKLWLCSYRLWLCSTFLKIVDCGCS